MSHAETYAEAKHLEVNQYLWEVTQSVWLEVSNSSSIAPNLAVRLDRFLDLVSNHFDDLRMKAWREIEKETKQ